MKFIQTGLLALVLGAPGVATAGDIGELAAQCDDCHGPRGASPNSDVPIIGGQSAEYISNSLESFQDWGRPCVHSKYRFGDTSRPKTDMCKIAGGLTSEDIAALGTYYSGLPFIPAQQEFDPALVESGAALQEQHCESCHEQGGKGGGNRGPRLAGQWTPYLKATLKFVPTGEHLVPPAMEKTIGGFGDDELTAILSFYASQQN